MFQDDRGLLQGTLELLILKALTWNPSHGYGIARWIEDLLDATAMISD